MLHKETNHLRRWASATAVALLLALCLILLGSHLAAAGEGSLPQRPVPDRAQITQAALLAMEAGSRAAPGPQQAINPGFTVDLTYNAIWGLVDPGDTVLVDRTADGAYGAAEADGVGFFWTYLWHDNGQPANITGGDALQVRVNGSLAATLNPLAISGEVDVTDDQVTGNVAGLAAGTVVTATLGEGSIFADEPFATGAVAPGGDFLADLSGIADIGPYMLARVHYRDANGHTVQGYVYPSEVFRVHNWNTVQGYAGTGIQVTVNVYTTYPGAPRWSATAWTGPPHGSYAVNASDHGQTIEPGDVVEVDLGGGTLINLAAGNLEIQPNAATDLITGLAPPGATVRGYSWNSLDGYHEGSDVADGSGNYTLDLGLDLETWHNLNVGYADAEGDEVAINAPPPHVRAYLGLNNFFAYSDAPDQPVTYTLDTGTEVFVHYSWCNETNYCDRVFPGQSLEPGYAVTAELPDLTMSMTIADLTMELDTAGDQIVGALDAPGWLVLNSYQWQYDGYPTHGWVQAGADVTPPNYALPFPGFDIRDGLGLLWGAHYSADGHRTFVLRWQHEITHFEVQPPSEVEGVPPSANEVVTATLYSATGDELASSSDDRDDDPWRFQLDFHDYGLYIEPGHWVTLTSESGWTAGLQVPTLTVEADAATDLISGEGPKAQVLVEHHWDGAGASHWVPVDGYVLDRAYFGGDVQVMDEIFTRYQAPNGNRVQVHSVWPWMYVNYGFDSAGGAYPMGHTFSITVTDSGGAIKATATASTGPAGGGPDGAWEDGFTVERHQWSDPALDIQPGDWVHFRSDDGYTNSVQIGTITGSINVEQDTASGTLQVPWLASQTIDGLVGGWGFPGFVGFTVDLDASGRGHYFADFAPTDLPPDITIGASYTEPDYDRVYTEIYPDFQVYLPIILKSQ
jgi:hypothetical protein